MLDYIDMAKREIDSVHKRLDIESNVGLDYNIMRQYIFKGIEKDLNSFHYKELIDQYVNYFKSKNIPVINIRKGDCFYRARIGNFTCEACIDDFNTSFILPYYNEQITRPPALLVRGGRFNRAGVAYLYLSTDIETCIAEVHPEVGQECSVAMFRAARDVELLDLTCDPNDMELEIYYELLTEPVHEENRYKYLITQFISDVLEKINEDGLYFKSTQSGGNNIVSFNAGNFKLEHSSEEIYKVKTVQYGLSKVKDSMEKIAELHNHANMYNYSEIYQKSVDDNINYLIEYIQRMKSRRGDNKELG